MSTPDNRPNSQSLIDAAMEEVLAKIYPTSVIDGDYFEVDALSSGHPFMSVHARMLRQYFQGMQVKQTEQEKDFLLDHAGIKTPNRYLEYAVAGIEHIYREVASNPEKFHTISKELESRHRYSRAEIATMFDDAIRARLTVAEEDENKAHPGPTTKIATAGAELAPNHELTIFALAEQAMNDAITTIFTPAVVNRPKTMRENSTSSSYTIRDHIRHYVLPTSQSESIEKQLDFYLKARLKLKTKSNNYVSHTAESMRFVYDDMLRNPARYEMEKEDVMALHYPSDELVQQTIERMLVARIDKQFEQALPGKQQEWIVH